MHHTRLQSANVRRLVICLAFFVLLAAPAQGQFLDSRFLWATINVCDTLKQPDTIGIRASMPGSGKKGETMWMRFRVQYFSAADDMWHNLSKRGDSGFDKVGSAKLQHRESGVVFRFAPSAAGSYQLRGKVYFQWRRGRKVVRRTAVLTTAGHRSAAGSDPPGYSSDTCVLS